MVGRSQDRLETETLRPKPKPWLTHNKVLSSILQFVHRATDTRRVIRRKLITSVFILIFNLHAVITCWASRRKLDCEFVINVCRHMCHIECSFTVLSCLYIARLCTAIHCPQRN